MEQLVYDGRIQYDDDPEYPLYVGEHNICDELSELTGKQVSVRYWISDIPLSKSQIEQGTILSLSGGILANWMPHYSDCTGWLWTDRDLNIGGHDLLHELSSSNGKYVRIEVDVHTSAQ